MRWRGGRRSENVEDQRDAGGLDRGVRLGGGGLLGAGGIIVMLLGAWLLGVDPMMMLQLLAGGGAPTGMQDSGYASVDEPPPAQLPGDAPRDELADFVSVVVGFREQIL